MILQCYPQIRNVEASPIAPPSAFAPGPTNCSDMLHILLCPEPLSLCPKPLHTPRSICSECPDIHRISPPMVRGAGPVLVPRSRPIHDLIKNRSRLHARLGKRAAIGLELKGMSRIPRNMIENELWTLVSKPLRNEWVRQRPRRYSSSRVSTRVLV